MTTTLVASMWFVMSAPAPMSLRPWDTGAAPDVTAPAAGVTGFTSCRAAPAELAGQQFYALEFLGRAQPAAAAQRGQPVQRRPHDLGDGVHVRVAPGRRHRRPQLAERR